MEDDVAIVGTRRDVEEGDFVGTLVVIAFIVLLVQTVTSLWQRETILIPMTMLGLFVLSAAVMGFLFLSEPLKLFMENKKHEAVVFFAKVVGFFACFEIVFAVLILFT